MDAERDQASNVKSSFSRIKVENDLDEKEDSHDDDSDKEKEQKLDSKVVNVKPPYSYVAMIGKFFIQYRI